MSELERLIQELCPNGVEYKALWELTIWDKKFNTVERYKQNKVYKYNYYLAADLKNLESPNGTVKILTTSVTNLWADEEDVAETLSEGEIVCIPWGGNPIVQYYAGKFITGDNRIATSIDTTVLDNKFLYYCLLNQLNDITSFYRGSGIKHPDMSKVLDLKIPVPPIEVQREIVRILDNFTELTAELTAELAAELTARKKQYEYYRDELLTFGDEVEWLPLGTVFNVRNGYTPSKANEQFWEGGTIPWFRLEDIRKNGRFLFDGLQHITPAAVKRGGLFPANSLIISTTATIGEHALLKTAGLTNQQITNCSLKDKYAEKVNPQFAFYYFYKLGEWCKANINQGGGLAIIGTEKIKQFLFPIPPIEEQQRIVDILDRFDTLCNDISAGLPAEIEARQKQYEYYRDKLLNFKEMSV